MAVIGAVTVRVVPSFSGVSKSVAQNFTAAGVMGGRAMAKPIQTSLREAVRTSITASSTKALEQVEAATGAVAKAEEGLTRNRVSRQSVDARVLKAEENLSKAREDSRSTAGDIAGAEAALEKARLDQRTANVSVVESERTLTEAKSNATKASEAHEQALSSESTMLGKISSAMPAISEHLKGMGAQWQSVGESVSGVGMSLTKGITLPIAGATAAAAGLVGTLGFRRLTSIDTAQAQLRGLGYETEDVERITDQLVDALEGGMMTMGEATSVAAGALAAGVDEGEELERYIKLVDAAAVGMGRSVDETAMIFGRVQGSGRLMTQELNMIEQFMPGFAAAMSDSLGVSQAEFRELVTQGEISSEQFMSVMEDFAGGMASSYAESFEGMVQNTLAYIGILGQNLLSGAFPQMKEALEDFVGFLASDDVATWAQGIGEHIGEAFSAAITWVRDAITWWTELDGSTQRLIIGAIGFAAALGPVLLIIGKVITFAGGIISAIGTMIPIVRGAALAFRALGLAMFANPIGLIITGIAALAGGLAWFFTQTETGQRIWETVWGAIQVATAATVSWITDSAVPWIVGAWESITSGAMSLWGSIVSVWNGITDAIDSAVSWITGIAWPMIQAVWDGIVDGVKWVAGILEFTFLFVAAIFVYLGQVFWNIYSTVIKTMFDAFMATVRFLWSNVLEPIFSFIVSGFQWLGNAFVTVWTSVLTPMFNAFMSIVRFLWSNVARPIFDFIVAAFRALGAAFRTVYDSLLRPMFDAFMAIVRFLWNSVINPVIGWIINRWDNLQARMNQIWSGLIRPMIESFGSFITGLYTNYFQPAMSWIGDAWSGLQSTLSNIWNNHIKPIFQALGDFVMVDLVGNIRKGVGMIGDAWNTVANFFRTPINWVIDTVWNNGIKAAFDNVAKAVGSSTRLASVSTIRRFGITGQGDRGAIAGYATGGVPSEEWYLAGEEGPELIHRGAQSHRVYTADETREALTMASQHTDAPHHNFADLARHQMPIGGDGNWFTNSARWVGGKIAGGAQWVGEQAANALSWVRGKLADTAETFLKPLLDSVSAWAGDHGMMGQLGSGLIDYGVKSVMDWIRGEDDKALAEGEYDGDFEANPGGFNRPSGGPVTSRYGPRNIPGGFSGFHAGIDLGAPHGAAVRAAWSGVVKRTGWGPGNLGNIVVLNHGGYDTAYAHLSGFNTTAGSSVKGGDRIASVGSTGGNFAPHLHFERHVPGFYNPVNVNSLFRDKGGLIYPGMNQVLNNTGKAEYAFNQHQFDNLNRLASSGGGEGQGFHVEQHNHISGSQYRDAQDLRTTMRREAKRHRAGV